MAMGQCKGKWNRRKEESVSDINKENSTCAYGKQCRFLHACAQCGGNHPGLQCHGKNIENNSQSMYIAYGQYDCCVTNVVIAMLNQLTQWGEGWYTGNGRGIKWSAQVWDRIRMHDGNVQG